MGPAGPCYRCYRHKLAANVSARQSPPPPARPLGLAHPSTSACRESASQPRISDPFLPTLPDSLLSPGEEALNKMREDEGDAFGRGGGMGRRK